MLSLDTVEQSYTISERPAFTATTSSDESYVEGIPLPRESQDIGFMSAILLFTVLYYTFVAILRLKGRGLFTALFQTFVKKKNAGLIQSREMRPNYSYLTLALSLSMAALAMLLNFLLHGSFVFKDLLIYFLILCIYHFLALGGITLCGWTFNKHQCARILSANLWAYNSVLGIALSPFILGLYFISQSTGVYLLWIIFGLFFIYFIFRVIRWLKILFENRVSIFYLILYLCALEILPLFVLYKLLGGNFG